MRNNLFKIYCFVIFSFVLIQTVKADPRNVLIEYVTGTWCGNCPCGHQTLNTISSQYPQTIIIAYHAFSNDPFRNFNGNNIVSLMGFFGTPTADIDRSHFLGNSNYPLWISTAQSRYNSFPESRVRISITSKSYNETTRELNLNINSTALENLTGQFKINFVITENNLIYEQNYYSQCGTPGYVQEYIHNHVARNMINGATGENLNSGNNWNANQTFTNNLTTYIDQQWNPENCKAVIFVYKEESALNASAIQQAIEAGVTGTTGINIHSGSNPEGFNLSQNYPNPFNPTTSIKFSIPKDGIVKFNIYDILGREVQNYINGFLQKGSYNVEINGTGLSGGIYFYRLETGGLSQTKRMLLVK